MSRDDLKIIWHRGFTLVEILIALAILAMIVASTFTIFKSSSSSWQKGETRSERYHSARVAMGRMSKEISHAVINEFDGSRFIGTSQDASFIAFVSTSSGVFELVEIEYWIDTEQKLLMRNEQIDPDYDFSTQDYSDILAGNISELEFSYYDGLIWSDSWDSDAISEADDDKELLPIAVKIKIKIEDKAGKESEVFEVVTKLKTV
ncbi:MAG: prepilin-type N-terminal cleavage/methylation domain-containing protein [Candidatus Omnitrophota bacterium]|nr:prepilin-type N-terminal cleavage/methylation domain-containing protein [Candidatus Omnitrophota bacterium]|tara:strand:- start:1610 stop:2224 length:615 start_codon:yes stop_codon:yes gene_type:complete